MKFHLLFVFTLICFITQAQPEEKKSKHAGDAIFNSDSIHEIRIYFNQCNYLDSLKAYKENDSSKYLQTNVSMDGKMFYAVGTRYKGESSYDFSPEVKKSLKLKFNEYRKKQDIDGLSAINLNNGFKDPTFLREKLCADFLLKQQIPTPRVTYANVYINDKLIGLYLLQEPVGKDFYQNNFGNKSGNAYKGDPAATFEYFGLTDTSYYKKYIKETNITENKWNDLIGLITAINDSTLSDEQYKTNLDKYLNTESCLKSWVMMNAFVNIDTYNMILAHNFFLYFNTTTGKFEWIPYDFNYAFGAWSPSLTEKEMTGLSPFFMDQSKDVKYLQKRLFKNSYYRAYYLNYYKETMNNSFISAYFNHQIDSLSSKIRPSVYYDKNKLYSNQDFEDNLSKTIGNPLDPGAFIPGLKSFITSRITYLKSELKKAK
jgi:spore coat protein H